MTPHTPSGFVDVRSDAASLQPALVSLHALPDANTHSLRLSSSHAPASFSFLFFLNQISCQHFDVPHIFCQSLCRFTPSFPSPPLSCHVACCFQADEDEVILNINHLL